jgi:hypothetical protein
MSIEVFKKNILEKGKCSKKGVVGDVNIKINGLGIGGSLTILFNWLCLFGDKVENIYVDLSDGWKESTGINKNIFDLILDQRKIEGAPEIQISGHYLHNFNDDVLGDIRNIINDKIKIKPEILKKINDVIERNEITNINELCGVHIRLTDMFDYHSDIYGKVDFDSYLSEMYKLSKDTKYFIASDNSESISKLKNIFGERIHYISDITRTKNEKDTGKNFRSKNKNLIFTLGVDRLKSDDNVINDFIDLMVLSKCNKLIGMKYSTYRIAALLLSNNITQNNNIELPLNYSL